MPLSNPTLNEDGTYSITVFGTVKTFNSYTEVKDHNDLVMSLHNRESCRKAMQRNAR